MAADAPSTRYIIAALFITIAQILLASCTRSSPLGGDSDARPSSEPLVLIESTAESATAISVHSSAHTASIDTGPAANPTIANFPGLISSGEVVGHPVNGVVALVSSATPDHSFFQGRICGGVLIEPQLVLTAAHCVDGYGSNSIDAVIGADNLCGTIGSVDGMRVKVIAITVHDSYDSVSGQFDLATLELEDPVPSAAARQVEQQVDPGKAVAYGWGSLAVGGPGSCRLMSKLLDILPNKDCAIQLAVGERDFHEESMFCARPAGGSADTCSGDSGSPVFAIDEENYELALVGVVSWGYGCGGENAGVYARADAWARH